MGVRECGLEQPVRITLTFCADYASVVSPILQFMQTLVISP